MDKNQIIKKYNLNKHPLFSELDSEQLLKVIAICEVNTFFKNEMIFKEGNIYKGFYLLLKGTVRVFKKTSTDREITLHIIKPFNTFADVPLFEGKTYPVNAQSADDSIVLFFPCDKFKNLLLDNSTICFRMLGGFAKRMRDLTRKIEDLTLKDVSGRLAEFLLEEADRSGTANLPEPYIKLVISKKSLASFLGTVTETLSRTFYKLEKENLIKVSGKKIFIKDFKLLKNLTH